MPPSAGSSGGSSARIRPRKRADPRNENASSRSAAGALRICTRIPPRLGPATYEKARLPFKSEFAST
jgi:hypothetical protein